MNAQTPTNGERPNGEGPNGEGRRRQRARSWAIFLVLAAFVVIVYIVTIVRMQGG